MSNGKIVAPWSDATVQELNQYQVSGLMHPFTCRNDHSGEESFLLATRDGWICPEDDCTYTQDWAHSFMADPGARRTMAAMRGMEPHAE